MACPLGSFRGPCFAPGIWAQILLQEGEAQLLGFTVLKQNQRPDSGRETRPAKWPSFRVPGVCREALLGGVLLLGFPSAPEQVLKSQLVGRGSFGGACGSGPCGLTSIFNSLFVCVFVFSLCCAVRSRTLCYKENSYPVCCQTGLWLRGFV